MPIHQVYQAASPYNASELAALSYEQTADTIYLAHRNHAPGKLLRYAHTDFRFASVTFGPTIASPGGIGVVATKPNQDQDNDGNAWFPQPASYVVTAYNEDTGQESRASVTVTASNDLGLKRNYNTITWSTVSGATGYRIYKGENTQSFGYIGTTTSTTFRDDNIGPDLSEGPPVGDNPFLLAEDYPAKVTFHEQRSYWANTQVRPNAIYASRSADYENMDYTRPSRADDGFVIGLVANKVNAVEAMVSLPQGMVALTSNNVFSVQGSNEDYITAVPPPRVRAEVKRGASSLRPIGIDNVTLYETPAGQIRALGFEYEIDGLRSNDLTIFSRHLFEGRVAVDWTYSDLPASLVLQVRDDGKINALTIDMAQQVWGWTVWETDGLYKGIASIKEQDEDRVYFLIEREIDGDTKLYVERMASELWEQDGLEYACFLDCAKTFVNEEPTSFFTHLEHLEGKTVVAFVDGAKVATYQGQSLVVTDGELEIGMAGTRVTIGLPYSADIETLPLAQQMRDGGWTVARPQDVNRVVVRVVNSGQFSAGAREDDMIDAKMREGEDYDAMDLVTGDVHLDLPGSSGREAVVFIRSDDPMPLHVAAVMVEATFGDLP